MTESNLPVFQAKQYSGVFGLSSRIFVTVTADFDPAGHIMPKTITWQDGRQFDIDKVLDVRPATAKSGGSGIRYLCRILGHEIPLYYDEFGQRWWCDGKTAGQP